MASKATVPMASKTTVPRNLRIDDPRNPMKWNTRFESKLRVYEKGIRWGSRYLGNFRIHALKCAPSWRRHEKRGPSFVAPLFFAR